MNRKLLDMFVKIWLVIGVSVILPFAFYVIATQSGDTTLIGIKYDNCKQLVDDTVYFENYTDIMKEVQKQLIDKKCSLGNLDGGRL